MDDEQRMEIFERDHFTCICQKSIMAHGTPQLAHRIPQRKHLLRRFGKDVIHHPVNMVSTCSLECNAEVSIAQDTGKIIGVLEEILEYEQGNSAMEKKLKSLIEELRKGFEV